MLVSKRCHRRALFSSRDHLEPSWRFSQLAYALLFSVRHKHYQGATSKQGSFFTKTYGYMVYTLHIHQSKHHKTGRNGCPERIAMYKKIGILQLWAGTILLQEGCFFSKKRTFYDRRRDYKGWWWCGESPREKGQTKDK